MLIFHDFCIKYSEMKFKKGILITIFSILLIAYFSFTDIKKEAVIDYQPKAGTEVAYFASGCFWCVEAVFESVIGVEEAVSGYAGGFTDNPTYQSIGTGQTGHAEAVAVYYNPEKVSFETLVTVFFGSHDPTTVNGQKPDYGSQYRSIAFYKTPAQKKVIDNVIEKLSKSYAKKIVTEVTPFTKFYKAEEYHQDFERRNPNQGYVKAVSIPRLNRFKKKFPELLKEEK